MKVKKSPHLSNGLTDRHEIWRDDANYPSSAYRPIKIWILKTKMTDGRHFENR